VQDWKRDRRQKTIVCPTSNPAVSPGQSHRLGARSQNGNRVGVSQMRPCEQSVLRLPGNPWKREQNSRWSPYNGNSAGRSPRSACWAAIRSIPASPRTSRPFESTLAHRQLERIHEAEGFRLACTFDFEAHYGAVEMGGKQAANGGRVGMGGIPRKVDSKPDLTGQLKVPGISRAGDRPEGGAAKRAVRIVQRRRVADVEDFRAEFQIEALR